MARNNPVSRLRSIAIVVLEFLGAFSSELEKDGISTWCYERAAKLGSSKAKNELGCRYLQGRGVERNQNMAFELWHEGAIDEYPFAQANLAWAYQNGIGTNVNLEAAYSWYARAAAGGHLESLYNVGLMYADGIGISKDKIKAAECLTEAAARGITQAREALIRLNG